VIYAAILDLRTISVVRRDSSSRRARVVERAAVAVVAVVAVILDRCSVSRIVTIIARANK
jgi:hypothetical protein